jgi:hypothetical protein
MNKEYWIKWAKAAGIRAVKTFAQAVVAGITVGVAINEINWKVLFSVATVAMIASIFTSIAGLPEVEE